MDTVCGVTTATQQHYLNVNSRNIGLRPDVRLPSKVWNAADMMDSRGPTSIMLSQRAPFKVNGVQTHLAEAGTSHTNGGFSSVSKVNVREVDIFAPHNHLTMEAQ